MYLNKIRNKAYGKILTFCSICLLFTFTLFTQEEKKKEVNSLQLKEIEREVEDLMEQGKIPGMTLIIVKGTDPVYIKGLGFANKEKNIPVTADTLFELGSCSKAFTALAILQLEEKGLINLDHGVSDYIPWFYAEKDGVQYKIALRHLIHHTSGIPENSIAAIPISNSPDALKETVKNIVGMELHHKPGSHFEYASINYDILGLVIEAVSGKSFEEYMKLYVLSPLGLHDTFVGTPPDQSHMAKGYKIGFFTPMRYDAPIFRGNNPGAYIISNGKDMAKWLSIQLGMEKTELSDLIEKSHTPNLCVKPNETNFSSYAMGWTVNQYQNKVIYHRGLNPNFSSYILMHPEDKIGIALLANSSSNLTTRIGQQVMARLLDQKITQSPIPKYTVDIVCSSLTFVFSLYLLGILVAATIKIIGALKGRIQFEALSGKKILRYIIVLLSSTPYLLGIYLVPGAMAGISWKTAIVWAPHSFYVAILLLLVSFIASYLFYFASLIFPYRNKYLNQIPVMILMSILTGLANTSVLFLITTSFFSQIKLIYLLFYFFMAYSIYIIGSKLVQTKMIYMGNNVSLDLRIDLIRKLLYSKFQYFETLENGRIYTTLNADTTTLSRSAGFLMGFITSIITATSAFLYLFTISIRATFVVLMVVVLMAGYYYLISRVARRYMEEARDTQNRYMSLLSHMIQGFRELSIHWNRKKEFEDDLLGSCKHLRSKNIEAATKFLHSGLIGNSFVMIILGMLSIVVPRVITNINTVTLISFVMVLLYLIGPINGILGAIPSVTRLKVSWDRIKGFIRDIEAEGADETVRSFIRTLDREIKDTITPKKPVPYNENGVDQLKVENLTFTYDSQNEEERFSVGPINFKAERGKIVFIIGGNGSGKTTLANLLTGLYIPDTGHIKIDGQEVSHQKLGEYFSTVFSNFHLFDKLYDIDISVKKPVAAKYLKILKLIDKVRLVDGNFSRLNLSGGQRKRLALLLCYLEDCPIYLFDEVAADQDPEFRKFFYRELLPGMKEKGKIVIAITHDDHYFDVADTIIKLNMGKLEFISNEPSNSEIVTNSKKLKEINKN